MAKNKEVIFDSNIWIAFLNNMDSTSARALDVMDKYDSWELLVPEYVAVEVSTILVNQNCFDLAHKFLSKIEENEDTKLLPTISDYKETSVLFRKRGFSKLSFIDTYLLQLAQSGYRVETFDKALQKEIAKVNK